MLFFRLKFCIFCSQVFCNQHISFINHPKRIRSCIIKATCSHHKYQYLASNNSPHHLVGDHSRIHALRLDSLLVQVLGNVSSLMYMAHMYEHLLNNIWPDTLYIMLSKSQSHDQEYTCHSCCCTLFSQFALSTCYK